MKKLTLILSMMIALIGLNANAAIYIVGDNALGGWTYNGGNEMTDDGTGVYTYNMAIPSDAGYAAVYFVFADGQGSTWDDFNGNYRIGPTAGDVDVTAGQWTNTQKAGGNNGAYKFMVTKGETYTITYNANDSKFMVAGYVAPIEITTYSVVGDFNGWNVNSADDIMTLANGVYTLNKQNLELQMGNFEYKFIGNHDYGIYEYPHGSSNLSKPVEKHGYYDVAFTFVPETETETCTLTLIQEIEDPIIVEHTYTVAGNNTTLFGSEWDPTDTSNDMTLTNGLYTWNKDNVELTAGEIEFKVVMDHNWNNGANAWPSENYVANIEENGTYDVTITFNPETEAITFEATPTVIVPDYYIVAGYPMEIFGDEWNEDYAPNTMALVDGLYTWTKANVELAEGDTIEFKVVKNSNWDFAWPEMNYQYVCQTAGTYNLTITYNPETNEVILNVAQPVEPVEITSYTVVGPTAVFGSDWDATDVNNDMVLGENGIYTLTKENVALYGNFSFKVVGNHDFAVYEWPVGYGSNYDVTVAEEGIYTIAITFDPNAAEEGRITCTLTKTGDVVPVDHVYTVAGTENLFTSNWSENDTNNDMVLGENGIYTWTKNGVEFALNDVVEFKVVQDHSWDINWPSSNWYWQCEDAGAYDVVITFDPAADDMHKITFTATKQTAVRGDADGNGVVGMDDLSAMISYLVYGTPVSAGAAICDDLGSTAVTMDDLSALINYLVYGTWPAEPVVEHVYTIAGTENLFGSNWNPADEANDMVKGNDGIYTWTKENVEFTEYATIEFKVVEDHSWDNSAWPSSNWWAEITEPGMYNFVITFDPTADDMSKITYTATKQVVE